MGVSISLFRVKNIDSLDDIRDINEELKKNAKSKIDLYQISGDLAIIFSNEIDPFDNTDAISYKMVYGNSVMRETDIGIIGGFLPASELSKIIDWINENKLTNYEGFSNLYDNLSDEVKEELIQWGTEDKEDLYNGYIKELIEFYLTAVAENNSIVFVGT